MTENPELKERKLILMGKFRVTDNTFKRGGAKSVRLKFSIYDEKTPEEKTTHNLTLITYTFRSIQNHKPGFGKPVNKMEFKLLFEGKDLGVICDLHAIDKTLTILRGNVEPNSTVAAAISSIDAIPAKARYDYYGYEFNLFGSSNLKAELIDVGFHNTIKPSWILNDGTTSPFIRTINEPLACKTKIFVKQKPAKRARVN